MISSVAMSTMAKHTLDSFESRLSSHFSSVAGLIGLKVNGVVYSAKGAFEYNLGLPLREDVNGSDGPHGYKEVAQSAYIAGKITDRGDLDLAALFKATKATVSLDLGNGKTFFLYDAWYSGDQTGSTEENEIDFRFSSRQSGEVV